jgi:hypothetical protein
MRRGLLAGAAAVLVAAGSARATPHLNVSATTGTTTIAFTLAAADASPAHVSILADPTFASVELSAPPGTVLGTVAAKASAGALGGAVLPLTGTVKVVAPDGTYLSSGSQVPVANASAGCTGSPTHTTFWVLTLSAAGQSLEVPLSVDSIANSPITKATINLCLPSPYVPAPEGAAFGVRLLEAILTIKGVFPTTPGDYRWSSLVTTYAPGTATVQPGSTVETQALEHVPGAVTFAARRSGKGKAAVSGKVTENGKPVANAAILVAGGRKPLRLKTSAAGTFKGVVAVASGAAKLRASATVPQRDLGASACTQSFPNAQPPIPCLDAVDSGFTVTTPAVKPR